MAARVGFQTSAMAARSFLPQLTAPARRSFQTSHRLLADGVIARRPVGAFRGTLFGFLLGSVLSASGLYYWVVDEYKVSNKLLTEDIYTLQSTVLRIENYVRTLEEDIKTSKK